MALHITRTEGQGIRIGEGDDAVWIYIHRHRSNNRQFSVRIWAKKETLISREEQVVNEGGIPGPGFTYEAYPESRLKR